MRQALARNSGGTIESDGIRSPRASGDAGAVLIEFAIILPVMLILAFGLIQLGFAFKTSSTITGASRTGARAISSTYPAAARSGNAATLLATLENVRISVERDLEGMPDPAEPLTLWIFKANLTGEPTGGSSCASDCIRYTWNGTMFASRTGTWASPNACGTNVDNVGVRIFALHDIDSPFLNDITVERDTIMRLEPVTDAAC